MREINRIKSLALVSFTLGIDLDPLVYQLYIVVSCTDSVVLASHRQLTPSVNFSQHFRSECAPSRSWKRVFNINLPSGA